MQDPPVLHSGQSADVCSSISCAQPTQPQHYNLIHQVDVSLATSAVAPKSDLIESMNLKKRCSSSLSTHSATTFAHTADATLAADIGSTSAKTSSESSIPVAKRKRVSFCGTTKEGSPSNSSTTPLVTNNLENQLPASIMKARSCTSLPALVISASDDKDSLLASTGELDMNVSPTVFVRSILLQSKSLTGSISGEDIIKVATQRLSHESYFLTYTEEQAEAYNNEKVFAVQGDDVESLRALHHSGEIMQTSNRFGESLLHTSCRRGFVDIVRFFINEAGVSPRVRDDMGRTPMHDACWSSSPPNHDIMKLLITSAPELLLSKDRRGHSPFDYARREYWPHWVAFLNEHRQLIVNCLLASFLESPGNVGSPLPEKELESYQ